jgi:hypothetical protein
MPDPIVACWLEKWVVSPHCGTDVYEMDSSHACSETGVGFFHSLGFNLDRIRDSSSNPGGKEHRIFV